MHGLQVRLVGTAEWLGIGESLHKLQELFPPAVTGRQMHRQHRSDLQLAHSVQHVCEFALAHNM